MVRMRLVISLALAFVLLATSAAQADTNYMPVVREESLTTVYVHVVNCMTWTAPAPLDGYRVTVYGDGRRIIGATTSKLGDIIMQAPMPATITVALDTGQAVTVRRGSGNAMVAFWVGYCATEATNWEQVR